MVFQDTILFVRPSLVVRSYQQSVLEMLGVKYEMGLQNIIFVNIKPVGSSYVNLSSILNY
jgi:hypothetical protein